MQGLQVVFNTDRCGPAPRALRPQFAANPARAACPPISNRSRPSHTRQSLRWHRALSGHSARREAYRRLRRQRILLACHDDLEPALVLQDRSRKRWAWRLAIAAPGAPIPAMRHDCRSDSEFTGPSGDRLAVCLHRKYLPAGRKSSPCGPW
jgi:hypothetical protein